METNERRQLHDEILDGTVDIQDVSDHKLADFREDFDVKDTDYQPEEDFYRIVGEEQDRRKALPRTEFNRDFYK